MSIGSRIKERREELGLTQIELADAIGVSKGAIGNYETDSNSPKASMLYKIFDILKCDANFIFQDGILARKEWETSPEEIDVIKKYRRLDDSGKSIFNTILSHELERIEEISSKSALRESNIIQLLLSDQPASAGSGVYLGPESMSKISVIENDLTRRASFAVPVSGDSMEPLYHDGDILLVDGKADVRPGQVGVFTIDGEGFVKELGNDELISLNPEYPNIALNESCRCNGLVVGVLRSEMIFER